MWSSCDSGESFRLLLFSMYPERYVRRSVCLECPPQFSLKLWLFWGLKMWWYLCSQLVSALVAAGASSSHSVGRRCPLDTAISDIQEFVVVYIT